MAAWCRCHVVGCRFALEPPASAWLRRGKPGTETKWPVRRSLGAGGRSVTCQRACHGVAERRWVLPAPCELGTHGLAPCVKECTWHTLHHAPTVHHVHHVHFNCPLYRHSSLCSASQREYAMFFGELTAHGARGETLLFPPCTPFSPVCCKEACGAQCGSLRSDALAPSPSAVGRLSARWRHGAAAMWSAVGLAPSRASRLRLAPAWQARY